MKKIIALIMTAASLLVACGGGGSGEEEGGEGTGGNVKLKIRFHVDEKSAEAKAYKVVISEFNKAYSSEGIKATASFVARTAGDSAYERDLANEMLEGTLPDIITFDAPNCAAYAKAGYLYDITNLLTSSEKAQYISLNKYQNKVYGVPIQESSAGFYYNKALFSQAGIDVSDISVENPWDFDRFKSVCAQLKSHSITPVDMRYDATRDETAMYLLYPFIYAAGGSFIDDTGLVAKGYFNSAKSKEGYQFLKSLVKSGYTSTGIGATDFFTGKVGMYLSSGWTIPDLDNNYKSTFPNRDSWGLLPYPRSEKAASATGSWSFAVGNNGKNNKSAAIKLLKYVSNKDSSKTITDATGMIPANKEVDTNYPAGSAEAVLYQQLQSTGTPRPETVGYPELSKTFAQVISGMINEDNIDSLVDAKAQDLQNNLDKIK